MTTGVVAPHRCLMTPERESFWYLVHAEWTKIRTVRGWVIAALVTIVAITAFAFLGADVSGGCVAAGAQSDREGRGSSRRWPQPSATRIDKQVLVRLPTDSRAGNVMWLLSVGGRAYAERNGDLQESC